jgi:uncharacterized membrane protein required for colicin V production
MILLGGAVGCGIYGGWRGAIRQVASVAAFLLAFLGTRVLADYAANLVDCSKLGAYIIVFCVIYIGVNVAVKMLRLTVKLLLLAPVDAALGALIGACKWLLGCSLILNLLHLTDPQMSIFAEPAVDKILSFAPWLFGCASELIK